VLEFELIGQYYQVKSSLLNTRLQLKAELIHTETIEKCYA